MQKDKCAVKTHVTPLVDIERLNQSTNPKNRSPINGTASCFLGSTLHSSKSWVDIIMLPHAITLMESTFHRYTSQQVSPILIYTNYPSSQLGGNKKKRELGFANRKGRLSRWQSRSKSLGENKRRQEEGSVGLERPHCSARGHCAAHGRSPAAGPPVRTGGAQNLSHVAKVKGNGCF